MQIPRLREWRELHGWTQKDLARESGVSLRSIAGYEAGAGARPNTARKLAEALGVGVPDLVGASGKAQAPPSPEQPSLNGLLEEERRAEWDAAVGNARQLRERGRARMEELLASWRESKNRAEDPAARRPYLDEIGELLQEAYDAETALVAALSGSDIVDQWPEVQAADRFYIELWRLVQGAGLSIRTGNAQEGRPEAVEEREAA